MSINPYYPAEQVSDAVRDVLDHNPTAISMYRQGKSVMGFLVGQVARVTGGRMSPKTLNDLILTDLKRRVG